MPLKHYGVLKGRPIEVRLATSSNAHYNVHLVDDTTDWRIAINVASAVYPSEVEYVVVDEFSHPLLAQIEPLTSGYTELPPGPTSGALDFIRGNLFDRTQMKPLPFNVPGADNDLNEKLDAVIQRALGDELAMVYAFGERWGPEAGVKDKFFGYLPGNGIHDIHMNQGNVGSYTKDDGVWQDGGLLLYFPSVDRWTAVFLKFQSQSWHTDDVTGHTIATPAPVPLPDVPPGPEPSPVTPGEPDLRIRIVAALVNPHGGDQGHETVTLLNVTDVDQPLAGWALANRNKARFALAGVITAGATATFTLPVDVPLSNDGGLITLLDASGLKVHGVSYTKAQAAREGWTVAF